MYVWEKPIALLTHKGITVYLSYRDQSDSPQKTMWITTDAKGKPENVFSIRRLSEFDPVKTVKDILIAAIDNGNIRNSH
jgi:hypothetical protein